MSRKSHFKLARLLVLAALLVGGNLWAEKISLYTGDTSRGGFGDVAANILMAQKLLDQRPQAEVHVLIAAESLGTVVTLEPGLAGLDGMRKVNGITYHLEGKSELPPTDVGLHFASDSKSRKLSASAPLVVRFEEYGGFDNQFAAGVVTTDTKDKATFLQANAGAGEFYGGLYVSQKKPAPPVQRSALFEQLDAIPGRYRGDLNVKLDGVKLGFAYSYKAQATEAYLEAVVKAAQAPSNRGQKFLVVVQHPISPTLEVPPNVQIRYFKNLPFEVSKALVAHSDIPILVTGDVSATLAVDYEKPFFYERLSWKKDFADGMARELMAANPKLAGSPLLRQMFGGVDGEAMPMKAKGLQKLAEEMTPVFLDPDISKETKRALKTFRKTSSLPGKLDQFLSHLEKLGDIGKRDPDRVLQATIEGKNLTEIIEILASPRPPPPALPAEPPPVNGLKLKKMAWDRPVEEVAKELQESDAVKRRSRLEKILEKAPEAFTVELVRLLAADPNVRPQLNTIAGFRDILCGLDFSAVKRPQ